MSDQDIALMAHLMRRAGFGATRDEIEARVAKGYEATVEELLSSEEQEELDRNEMMRFHPWTWRPNVEDLPNRLTQTSRLQTDAAKESINPSTFQHC